MRLLTTLSAFAATLCATAATITGTVTDMAGKGIADVAVSDGITVTTTDSKGRYSLESDKSNGLVFISTPSGYEAATSHGNRPDFWGLTTSPADENDIVNFRLRKVDDSKYAFVAMADNQLSNRHGEVNCFKATTVPDVNATLEEIRRNGIEPFVLLLGDQSHDCYWGSNRYSLIETYSDIELIKAPVLSVMGNHDHDPNAMTNHNADYAWRRFLGPTYYSFNRGGVHFVVLDDIVVVDNSPTISKDGECVYKNRITSEQLARLRQDLALADKSQPLVVAMHAPLLPAPGSNGKYRLENGEELVELLQDFEKTEILSGHTHISYAATDSTGRIHESNYGAVCGSWWLNARVELGNDNNICRDGTPSGYAVWTYENGKFSNYYKGTGMSRDVQFRAYDLNMVEFENEDIASEFIKGRKKTNEILVNVWGYGPGWKVEMFERGKALTVEQVRSKDPLFLLSCPIPYLAQGNKLIGTVRPVYTWHMFKAKAKKANSDIEIRVTDREGRVFTQQMQRPKALTTEMY